MKINKDLMTFAKRGSIIDTSLRKKRPKTAQKRKKTYNEQHRNCIKVYNYVFTDAGSPKEGNDLIVQSEEDFMKKQKEKMQEHFRKKHSSMLRPDSSLMDS